jgi:predicted nucleic acid-binding protein
VKRRVLVLDASTAILLAKVDLSRMVSERASTWIALEALREATSKGTPDARSIRHLVDDGLIHAADVEEGVDDLRRDFRLHEGEAKSIVLAGRRKAVCGTDDGPAIRCCKVLGIPFITAIGILIALREADEIEESISMEILAKLERFGRYRARIIEDAGRRIRSHRRSETGGEP